MHPDHIVCQPLNVATVAIGICRTSRGNTHTGVAYPSAAQQVRFFHQAWDHDTRDEPISDAIQQLGGPFLCVDPSIEDDRARAIASFWAFVASRGEQIGYALRDDPDALYDPNTGLLAMPNGRGLTCATFILVLFRSVRFPLIDTRGWPAQRAGDAEAQQRLVQHLQNTCPDKQHVEAVRQEIGCVRVRPEEIAGAALYRNFPVRYPEAEDGGHFINGGLTVLSHVQSVRNASQS